MVDQLDMSNLLGVYAGKCKTPYHPAMLVALLFYCYATGTFSSRKLEKATYDCIAYRYICDNTHPDHDTIASFRKRLLKDLEGFFVEMLLVGQAMGLVKLGTVSLDGTKIKANASKHKALSWAHANKLEAQLQAEVDNSALSDEMNLPEELKRRRTPDEDCRGQSRDPCPCAGALRAGAGGVRGENVPAQGPGITQHQAQLFRVDERFRRSLELSEPAIIANV